MTKQSENDGLIAVRLLKPHTDRGVNHPAGAVIRLRPDQIARLSKAGVVEEPAQSTAVVAEPAAAESPKRGKTDGKEVKTNGL